MPTDDHDESHGTEHDKPVAGRPTGQHGPGQQPAGEGGGEGDQRGTAKSGQSEQWPLDLGEGELSPGESAVGHPSAQRFLGHPSGGGPDRPAGQPLDKHQDHTEWEEEQRLKEGKQQPGHRADLRAGPWQERYEEAQPDQESEQRGSADRLVTDKQCEGSRNDDGDKPEIVGRKREDEHRPGCHSRGGPSKRRHWQRTLQTRCGKRPQGTASSL